MPRAVRKYSQPGPSSLQAPLQARSLDDYDLEDLDDDVLLNEGEIDLDSDDEEEEEENDESALSGNANGLENNSDDTARRRRRAERHWSYLLSLLRARQKRLEALLSASERLGLVRALMANKGGTSVRKMDSRKQELTDAVAKGKMTKNGLALPGNEDEDDSDTEINGSKPKSRVTYKFGKERKR